MKREQILFSTVAEDALSAAKRCGSGLELAQFCTACNMDERFAQTDAEVKTMLKALSAPVLHGPFNELFPCAIDPKARGLAAERYRQAAELCPVYGCAKLVLHGGYNPKLYYPMWYIPESVKFWKSFMAQDPDVTVCLENVFEETPEMLLEIAEAVDDRRIRLCLDLGHVNAYSAVPAETWLRIWAPYISHFHVHNNPGDADMHQCPGEGSLPMEELLHLAEELCPEATYTMEVLEAEKTAKWLEDKGFLT